MEFEQLKGKKYDHTLKWMLEAEPQGFFAWLMAMLGQQGFVLKEVHLRFHISEA